MTRHTIKHGREKVEFSLPDNWQVELLSYRMPEPLQFEEALFSSLDHPIDEVPLAEWLKPLKKILIVVPDITRYAAVERILPLLMERYLKGHDVRIIFALGNHRKQTEQEKRQIVSDAVYEATECFDHDCFDRNSLEFFGKTSTGLDVVLNKAIREADGIIATGSINFHYLAGFGGGRKAIFPGISGYETIIGIHGRVFNLDGPGKHVNAKSGILKGNPMHEEIMQGIGLIKTPMFLINTVLNDKNELLNIFAGNLKTAHEKGCEWYAEHFAVNVEEGADIVIVSCGGFPKDINFIQSHKAIEHAIDSVSEGGTLIVCGMCEDGLGNDSFLQWFDYTDMEEMEAKARASNKVYAQTAYATRLKANRRRIVLVSNIAVEAVEKMGIIPKGKLHDALRHVDDGQKKRCFVIPNGSTTLVRRRTKRTTE